MVHEDAGEHRLGDRRGADTHTRVVAPGGLDRGRAPLAIDGAPGQPDARSRLERNRHGDLLAGRDAAEHAAIVVGEKALRAHLVAVLRAFLRNRREAGADLDTLHRVDAHHRRGNVGVEPAVNRLAPADGHAFGDDVAARIAHAVLLQVGVIGVSGAELVGDRRVVLRALVLVADEKADRRAGGAPFINAGEQLDRVRLAPLRHMARAAGLSPVELALYI